MAYLSSFGRQTTEVTTTKRYVLYTLQSGPCIVTSYNEYVGEEEKETERTKKVKTGLWHHVARTHLMVHLPPKFFHSPSNQHESQFGCEMFDFWWGKCLHECVCNHVSSWAKNKSKGSFFDDPADKMETDINVFGACVILMILCQGDGWLIVGKKCCHVRRSAKELGD